MTSKDNISAKFERLYPPLDDATMLTIACDAGDYSASAIARAVEDCDAHLLNLNVTGDGRHGRVVADLRVNRRDGMPIARSLERYGYTVTAIDDDVALPVDETLRERVNELLRLLE